MDTDTTHTALRALTTTSFDEAVAASPVPFVVDFWATWCGPCGPYAAVVAELAVEQAGRISVGTVDIDAEPDLARRYGVMSAPTLLVFVDGQPVQRLVGARGIGRLREDLAEHL